MRRRSGGHWGWSWTHCSSLSTYRQRKEGRKENEDSVGALQSGGGGGRGDDDGGGALFQKLRSSD